MGYYQPWLVVKVGKNLVKTYQTALNKNLFSIILAFLMFVPKYALAVDNPFSDRINYSFFIQFCLLIIVLLAVLILTNTQYWRSQTPRLKVTIVTLGLLLTATTTHFLFPSPVQNRPPFVRQNMRPVALPW